MPFYPPHPLDMVTFQTDGVFDYSPELEGMDKFWFYEVPQVPWGTDRTTPADFAGLLYDFLPGAVNVMRAPYHLNYFVEIEGVWELHPRYMQFLKAWVALGGSIVWDWHDGPTQEVMETARRLKAPDIYPPTDSRDEVNAAFVYLGERQIAGYSRLLDMLDRAENADLKTASVGFELMNEPASYLAAAQRYQADGGAEYFYGLFVDHIEALSNLVKARMPGRFLIAPAAGYNGRIDVLVETYLPSRSKSAWDAMVEVVGLDYMILGIHFYPGFDKAVRTQTEHTKNFNDMFGAAGSIPIAITETNIEGGWMDTARTGGNSWRSFFNARHLDFLRADLWPGKKACGITYWPFFNYAQNSQIRIRLDLAGLQDDYRNTRVAWMNHLAHRDGQDTRYFGALVDQVGAKGYEVLDLYGFNSIRPHQWEPDGWHLLLDQGLPNSEITVNGDAAISYGGRGLTTHAPPDGAVYSITLGGDGKTVIWDHENEEYRRNHHFLGKGGGVVRLGPGSHAVMSQGGPTRVYTWPADVNNGSYCAISYPYGWDNTTIIDPDSSFVSIYGFNPARGDRLSFKGYFESPTDLRAHCQRLASGSHLSGEDLIINLPGGGYVLMAHGGGLLSSLHKYVLDLTDGWYVPGWTEPLDIEPGDELIIGPPVPPPLVSLETNLFDALGRPILELDAWGRSIGGSIGYVPPPDPEPEPDPLLAHYASGAILIHHRESMFATDGEGLVTGMDNAGGAGGMFDATVFGPPLVRDGAAVITDADSVVSVPTAADLVGVRLMFVASTDGIVGATGNSGYREIFGLDGEFGVDQISLVEIRSSTASSTRILGAVYNGATPAGTIDITVAYRAAGRALYELAFTATGVEFWINGTLRGTSATVFTEFPIQQIGSSISGIGVIPYEGPLGDVLGVVIGHPDEAAATAAARAHIAAAHGITLGYDPDAVALFERMTTEPGFSEKALISDMFATGKNTDWWDDLTLMYFPSMESAQGSRLNWLSPDYTLVPVNAPVHTPNRGYAFNGASSYLDTQFNPSIHAGFSRDSASMGFRSNTNVSSAQSLMGFWDGSKGSTLNPRNTSDGVTGRINQASASSSTASSSTSSIGVFVASRTGATTLKLYRQGSPLSTFSTASEPLADGTLRIGGITNTSLRAGEVSFVFAGLGLTDAKIASIQSWFEKWRIAKGIT